MAIKGTSVSFLGMGDSETAANDKFNVSCRLNDRTTECFPAAVPKLIFHGQLFVDVMVAKRCAISSA